jgi:hypothetical protein
VFGTIPAMRILMLAPCLLAFSCLHADAQLSVKDYRATLTVGNKSDVAELKFYISGMGEGIIWANAEAARRKTPLFCEPDKLELVADNYLGFIDGQIKRLSQPGGATKAEVDSMALGVLLLSGLEETFPCKPNR